jgi:hypothetical protein
VAALATAMGIKRKSLPGDGKQAKSSKVEKPALCPTTEKLSQWLLGSAIAMSFGEALGLQPWQLQRLRSLIELIRGSETIIPCGGVDKYILKAFPTEACDVHV